MLLVRTPTLKNLPYVKKLTAIGAGQSNMAFWSEATDFGTAAGLYNNEGEDAFLSKARKINNRGRTIFLNTANPGSYLSKKAYDIGNIRLAWDASDPLEADDWWVTDTSGIFAAGPLLTEMVQAITDAGIAAGDVRRLIWSQGESDGAEIRTTNYSATITTLAGYSFTIYDYAKAFMWLKDYLFSSYPNLISIDIRPIGPRIDTDSRRYGEIRKYQQYLAATYPAQIRYGSEVYDLPNDGGTHRSAEGYTIEGKRAAYEILAREGLWRGNSVGPYIASASHNYAASTITLTVQQDKGTSLRNAAGEVFNGAPVDCTPSGSGMFALKNADGTAVTITSVQITGNNQITITHDTMTQPTSSAPATLTYGDGNMYALGVSGGIDANSIIYDNHLTNSLPLRASYSVNLGGDMSFDILAAMSGLVSLFTPDASYNAGGTASDAVVWTKRAGSGSSARKDDAKPAPTYASDISTLISGAYAIGGWVFDGTASQKLLVEHALTSSSNYTLFVTFTANIATSDASTHNAIVSTSTLPGATGPLFILRQAQTDLKTCQFYAGSAGGTLNLAKNTAPQVCVLRRDGATAQAWYHTGKDDALTVANVAAVDTDGGVPVFAMGNIPLHGSGSSDANTAFRGALHHVILFDRALTDGECMNIRTFLGQQVGLYQ